MPIGSQAISGVSDADNVEILASATADAPAIVCASEDYGWGQVPYLSAPAEAESSFTNVFKGRNFQIRLWYNADPGNR